MRQAIRLEELQEELAKAKQGEKDAVQARTGALRHMNGLFESLGAYTPCFCAVGLVGRA